MDYGLAYENDELLNTMSSSNCCFPSEKSVYEAIGDLDRETKAVAFFYLNLSDEDRHLLSGLKIKDSKFQTFSSLGQLQAEANVFLENGLSCETIRDDSKCAYALSELLNKITNSLVRVSGYDDAGIRIIIKAITERSGNLEWHTDPSIFEHLVEVNHMKVINQKKIEAINGDRYGFIFNLVGEDTTLFYNPTPEEKIEFSKYMPKDSIPNKKFDTSRVVTFPYGSGGVYFLGEDDGTIHTPPATKNQRLVISIIPEHSVILSEFLKVIE